MIIMHTYASLGVSQHGACKGTDRASKFDLEVEKGKQFGKFYSLEGIKALRKREKRSLMKLI